MAITLNGTTGITTPAISSTGASTFTGALALPSGGLTVGTDQLAVDASGRVTMPYQPAWHYTGGTTLSNSTWVICKPSTAIITNASYSASTGQFTAPVSGKYFVGVWGLFYPNGSANWTTGWFRNNATVGQQIQGGPSPTSHTHYSNSLIVQLSEGDTIDFRVYAGNDGMNAYSSQWNQFGYLIG